MANEDPNISVQTIYYGNAGAIDSSLANLDVRVQDLVRKYTQAPQDFTSYGVYDPNSRLSLETPYYLTYTNVPSNEGVDMVKDISANPISGDFRQWIDVRCDSADNGSKMYVWMLASDLSLTSYAGVYISRENDVLRLCLDVKQPNFFWTDSCSISTSTTYYLEIVESGLYVTCYVYGSGTRATPISTLRGSLMTGGYYRYLVPFLAAGTTRATQTGAVRNFDIDVSATGTSRVVVPDNYTDIGEWHGVGFTVTDISTNKSVGYMITNNMAAGSQYEGISGGEADGDQKPVDDITVTVNSTCVGEPIDVASGDVVHRETDFSIPNLGIPLEMARKYDSINTVASGETPWSDRGMGEGWSFSYSDTLTTSADPNDPAGTKIWFTSDGIRHKFTPNGQGGYSTPDTLFGTLVFNGTGQGYTWTDANANVVTFDDSGKLLYERDRYGSGVDVAYDGNGHIATVSDHITSSRHLTFTYTGSHITYIQDFEGRAWRYNYTNGRLTSVTANYTGGAYDPDHPDLNVTTSYAYYTDNTRLGLLETITNPDQSETNFAYYANRRGFQVTDSEGNTDSLLYDVYHLDSSDFAGRTTYIDRRGVASRYTYDYDGYLTERKYADWTTEGHQWTDGLVTSATDAYGQTETYAYYDDGTGDLHTCTDRAGNVTTYTYTADAYHNLASITAPGPNGNVVTTFSYSANSGKSLTDITEDSGGLNLHTTLTYEGTDGARGLPDSMTTPNGYLTPGDSNDYKTTYTYNAAGEALTKTYRVSSTHSIEESYTYDNRGNLTSYTDGEGNTTSYTYDLLDRVNTETDPDPDGAGGLPAPHVTYTYDAAGNLTEMALDAEGTTPLVAAIGYDSLGQVTSITNADGTYTTYHYDQGGNLVFESDGLGRLTQCGYDQRSRLIATIQPDGSVLRTIYDGGNRIVGQADALGNITRYKYDKLGQVTEAISPDPDGYESLTGLITLYGYYNSGDLRYVTSTYADGSGDPVATLGNANYTTEYIYDNLGRLTQEKQPDPDGGGVLGRPTTYYGYDADSNLSWVTDARGSAAQDAAHTTNYVYDEADRLTQQILPDPDGAGPLGTLTTRYFYDDTGNLRYVVDPRGTDNKEAEYTTEYQYDHLGRLTNAILPDPDGAGTGNPAPEIGYTYDAYGNLASVTDPLTHVTSYQYDMLGRCTAVTDALNNTSSVLYDAVGNVLAVTDASGAVSHYQYDSMDRLVQTTLPKPDASETNLAPTTTYQYDLNGNLTSVTDPLGNVTSYAYDNLGRLITLTQPDPDGGGAQTSPVTHYAYDAVGDLTSVTNPLGNVTSYAYDNLGRLITLTQPDPDGGGAQTSPVTHYVYDAVGDLTSVTDPLGNVTSYAYDNLGRLITLTQPDPDGGGAQTSPVTHYAYDAVGNLASVTDPMSNVTTYAYDNLGRLVTLTQPDPDGGGPQTSPATHYAYDAVGNVTSVTDPLNNVTSYAYDNLGRLVTLTQPDPDGGGPQTSPVTQYAYDAVGNLTSVTDPLDHVTGYAYDRLGRVVTLTQPDPDGGGPQTSPATHYAFDAVGNLTSVTDALNHSTAYGYDNLYRVTSETDANDGETDYTYDANGNTLTLTDPTGNATAWTYDGLGRVVTETITVNSNPLSRSYQYDAAGELVKYTDRNGRATTYQYDHLGRETAENWLDSNQNVIHTYSYSYDANSDLLSASDSAASNQYTYDALGRATSETQTIAGLTPAVSLARQYDADSRLTQVAATIGGTADFQDNYQYDADNRLTQVTQQGVQGGDAVAEKRVDFAYNALSQFDTIAPTKTSTAALATRWPRAPAATTRPAG